MRDIQADQMDLLTLHFEQNVGSLIKISRGLFTLVDADWADAVISMGKWTAFNARGYFYAGKVYDNELIMLARLVNNTKYGWIADHRNGNTLDNREENLREVTRGQNRQNKHLIQSNNRSGFEGVWFDDKQHKWLAYITIEKQRIHLGSFVDKLSAVRIRIEAVKHHFGAEICQTSSLHQNNTQYLKQREIPIHR